jgi:uncharacterized heparinase superfamily protein
MSEDWPTGNRLRWAYFRLRAMSLPELAYRLRERRNRVRGRRISGWAHFTVGPLEIKPLPAALTDLFWQASGKEWSALYDEASEHQYRLLGQVWPGMGGRALWHLDPFSGRNWPAKRYCFDIDYRHQNELGDVRFVWEINRMQFLPPIAAYAMRAVDDDAARFCIRTILDWGEANPPFAGVNWASGIELALRVISILTTLSLLGPDMMTPNEHARIVTILNAHGQWLWRFPSRFSSANNHLVAEATALYLLGVSMPKLPGAAQYQDYGWDVLVREATQQFYHDGVGAEQSPSYAAFALELYRLAGLVAAGAHEPFQAEVAAVLAEANAALAAFRDSKGHGPRIGDDDEGRVFWPGIELGTGPYDVDGSGVRRFEDGGYSVFRQDLRGHSSMLVFDHGPLGHLSIAAHGHADALAVWLHVDNWPVFADAGTYLYHGGGAVRDWFRSTAAHNTLELNAASQSLPAGAFNWKHKARAWRIGGDETSSAALHDGYVGRYGVVHTRAVKAVAYGFDIIDRLEGPLDRVERALLRLYLDPHVGARDVDGVAYLRCVGGASLAVSVTSEDGIRFGVVLEEAEISPRFGELQPTTVLFWRVPPGALGVGVRTEVRFVDPQ